MNYPDDFINKIICGDCLEVMKDIPDNSIDLVVTDPPYGKQWARGKYSMGINKEITEKKENLEWDKIPNKKVFKEIFRVSKNQIIFGGNYFTNYLKPSNCWIVWDKKEGLKRDKVQQKFADCELVWTSFNTTVKKYSLRIQGFITDSKDERLHPTQKPSELFSWIIKDFSNENDLILDPFLGSGTTAVACKKLNRRFIGIEINDKYCAIAEERLKKTPERLDNILRLKE